MPRPIKTGLDYFYTDVHEMDQREMIHLLNQYGPLGYSIFQVIRCMIYENGYYLEDSMDSVAMVVTRTIGNRWIKDKSFVEKVINYCAELGLLDNDLLRKGVFTSKAIQLAYQAVTARSKADKTKYWLLADPASDPEAFFVRNRVYGSQKKGAAAAGRSLSPKGVSVEETPVSAQKTQVNPLSMHERKENKTKRDKSKAEESKGTDWLKENEGAFRTFLNDFAASSDAAVNDLDNTVAQVVALGVIPNEALAKQAIPGCNIVCVTGEDMKKSVSGFLDVLLEADPQSVGGALPDDGFYYVG